MTGRSSEIGSGAPAAPDAAAARASVARTSAYVGTWTLVSRVLGYVRDAVCVAAFGMGLEWGAFLLAWMVPNLFRRFLGEGALASAFIPEATKRHDAEGRAGLRRLLAAMQGSLAVVLVVLGSLLCASCFLVPPAWLGGVLEKSGQPELFLRLSAILIPYLAVCCTLALWMGVLNTVGHFGVPASSPALLNVVWIALALAIGTTTTGLQPSKDAVNLELAHAVELLAWGMLVGGFVQVVQFVIALRREGLLVAPRLGGDEAVGRIWRAMGPMVLGLAVVQLNLILDQVMAVAFVGEWANNYTYHANRLLQFPIGVVGAAVATAAFPLLARLGQSGKKEELGRELAQALRLVAFLAVPSGCAFALMAFPMVRVLFEHGKVTAADTHATAWTLSMYALGVPFLGSVALWTRAFYSLGDRKTPVVLAAVLVLVNAALNLALVLPFGVAGLGAATSVCAVLNSTVLCVLLRRRHEVVVFRTRRDLPWAMFVVGIGAVAVGALLERALRSPLGDGVALLVGLAVAAVLYLGIAALWQWPEMRVLRRRKRR
ncbi:MAG: murein biosynthesis integral membrane protein MurJ [Planctomycetes bacterium]|nr:murein biosynthesis integral membrane protein MurJ [Planctomycetota bacterium]